MKIFVRVVINVFLCLWKTWIFVVRNRISQDTGTELFRAHKTRTVPKSGMIWVHIFNIGTYVGEVTGYRGWLRHCATSQKVAGSMALGSTQRLTEMSTR